MPSKGPHNPKPFKSEKIWRNAITLAIHRTKKGEGTKRLNVLAEALVNKAMSGDVVALKEIGDRLDGKPVQAIDAKITELDYADFLRACRDT